jgi:hypothetical protein
VMQERMRDPVVIKIENKKDEDDTKKFGFRLGLGLKFKQEHFMSFPLVL